MNLSPSQHAELAEATRLHLGATLSPEQRLLLVNLAAHHVAMGERHKAAMLRFRTLGDATMAQHERTQVILHLGYADALDAWIAHG